MPDEWEYDKKCLMINETIMFENKIALITGGTGSFGEAVLERFK